MKYAVFVREEMEERGEVECIMITALARSDVNCSHFFNVGNITTLSHQSQINMMRGRHPLTLLLLLLWVLFFIHYLETGLHQTGDMLVTGFVDIG